MKVLDFGSINFDNVYRVNHIAAPGETISSEGFQLFFGGKGLNQAVAIAKAGIKISLAGMIGTDGASILELCSENGIDTHHLSRVEGSTGHAVIQVSESGENSIILFGGANEKNTRQHVDDVLADFCEGDILVLQNEINCLEYIVDKAYEKGMKIILNPSPYNKKLDAIDMNKISVLIMNEVEGLQMTGEADPDDILRSVRKMYQNTDVVLTLGSKGSVYLTGNEKYYAARYKVQVVDTTAAGDTFTGYFVAGLAEGMDPGEMMRRASYAAALAVSREGAIPSIPTIEEVEAGEWR